MSVDYTKANADIIQDTKDLVLSQFHDSDNVHKLVEIIAEESKSYEDIAEKIFTVYLLTEATGISLDSIGEFLNIPREGQSDDAYRTILIFSAIGANSDISRDSLANLLDVVTGQIGGYFYLGSYHDLYIYLQESCIDQEIAKEFIGKYLPVGTNASILLESGLSFGFENDDRALGFDTVRQSSSEGSLFVEYDISEIQTDGDPVLIREFKFEDSSGYRYRTNFETGMNGNIIAGSWVIPNTYSTGDVISLTLTDSSGGIFSKSYTIDSTATSQEEIAAFISKTILEISPADNLNVYTDDTTWTVYFGFQEITDELVFSSRATSATEYDPVLGKLNVKAIDVVRKRFDDTGTEIGLLYENYSENLYTTTAAASPVSGTVTTTFVDTRTFLSTEDISGVTLAAGEDSIRTLSATTGDSGKYTASIYIIPDNLKYTVSFNGKTVVFIADGSTSVLVDSFDFEDATATQVNIDGSTGYRLDITEPLDASTAVSVDVRADADQGTGGDFLVTCAQFEPWHVATSYIPADGGTQERASDYFDVPLTYYPVGLNDRTGIATVSAQDLSDFSLWSTVDVSGLTKGNIVVSEGDSFSAVDTANFTILSVVADGDWVVGVGEVGLVPTEESTSESGDFCSRISLTSRDVLPLTIEDGVFDYELDSKFSEIVGIFSNLSNQNPKPIQVVSEFHSFAPPAWDSGLSGASPSRSQGYAFRSPEGVENYSKAISDTQDVGSLSEDTVLTDRFDILLGDLEIPNKPFYFEISYDSLPVATATVALNAAIISQEVVGIPQDQNGGVQLIDFVSLAFDVTCNLLVDDTFSVEVEVGYTGESIKSVDGTIIENPATGIRSTPYSEVYDPLSPPSAPTFGILVEPATGVVRLYVDGVPYDGVGNSGILLVTSVSAGDYSIGDVFNIERFPKKMLTRIATSTENANPEPATIDDQGILSWVYKREDLNFTSQLPQNTVDIFGRLIQQN